MNESIQKADPMLRRRMLLGLALSAALGVAFIFGLHWWLGSQAALAAAGDPDRALHLVRRAFFACTALLSGALVGFGAYLLVQGRAAIASRRFPPPGARVAVDTPIREGIFAIRTGQALRVAGAASFLFAALLTALSWWLAASVA